MNRIVGVSYIGMPKPNTAMYVTAKASRLCNNLRDVSGCIVFAETGIEIPKTILEENDFRYSDNPLFEYACFTESIMAKRVKAERDIPYLLTENGAYVHQSAVVSKSNIWSPGL